MNYYAVTHKHRPNHRQAGYSSLLFFELQYPVFVESFRTKIKKHILANNLHNRSL